MSVDFLRIAVFKEFGRCAFLKKILTIFPLIVVIDVHWLLLIEEGHGSVSQVVLLLIFFRLLEFRHTGVDNRIWSRLEFSVPVGSLHNYCREILPD